MLPHWTRVEIIAREKHSSLSSLAKFYMENKFYIIGPSDYESLNEKQWVPVKGTCFCERHFLYYEFIDFNKNNLHNLTLHNQSLFFQV